MADGISRRSVLRSLGGSLGGALIDQQVWAGGVQVGMHSGSGELLLASPSPDILRIVFSLTGTAEPTDNGALDRAIGAPTGPSIPLTGGAAAKTVQCGRFSLAISNDPTVVQVRNSA